MRLPGATRAQLSCPRCSRGFPPPPPLVNGAPGYTQWLGVGRLAVFPLTSLSFTLFELTVGSSTGTPSQPSVRSCFCSLHSEAEGHLPIPGCPRLTPRGSEWVGGVKSSCAEDLRLLSTGDTGSASDVLGDREQLAGPQGLGFLI